MFTCNQSIDTRSSGFQDDAIDLWMCADRQSNHISLPFSGDGSKSSDKNFAGYQLDHVSVPSSCNGCRLQDKNLVGPLSANASIFTFCDGYQSLSKKPSCSLLADASISTSHDGCKTLSKKSAAFSTDEISFVFIDDFFSLKSSGIQPLNAIFVSSLDYPINNSSFDSFFQSAHILLSSCAVSSPAPTSSDMRSSTESVFYHIFLLSNLKTANSFLSSDDFFFLSKTSQTDIPNGLR